jgi:hypothetical protein
VDFVAGEVDVADAGDLPAGHAGDVGEVVVLQLQLREVDQAEDRERVFEFVFGEVEQLDAGDCAFLDALDALQLVVGELDLLEALEVEERQPALDAVV